MAKKKKRRTSREEASTNDETLANETTEDTSDDDTEQESEDEEVEVDEDELGEDADTSADTSSDALERQEVEVKLTSPKQFVAKLSRSIEEETTIFFKIGATLVAACECSSGADALVRVLPTEHAADLAQFLYDGLDGMGQDPQLLKDIDKNGYDYSVEVDW